MRNYRIPLSLLFIFSVIGLISSGCGEYIKRQPPDSSFARSRIGDAIFATSDFQMSNGEQRVVYKTWRFKKADQKSVTISYEENLDFIKLTPDVKEEKIYSIGKDFTIKIQDMVIEIFELTDKSMVYYIRSGH